MLEQYVTKPNEWEDVDILYGISTSMNYSRNPEIVKLCTEIRQLVPVWKRTYTMKYSRRGKRMKFDRDKHERQYRDAINGRIHKISQLQFWEQLKR